MKKTLQIRHYVMGLTLQAGNSSIKLPPLRELEKLLNASLGTLVTALKELSEDGYLTARKGIGYFTRPSMLDIPFDAPSPKMIGAVIGDGKNFYLGLNTYLTAPAIFEEFRKREWRLHYRNLEGHNGEECFREIKSWGCDAIYWNNPSKKLFPLIEQLIQTGTPVLSQSAKIKGGSSIAFDLKPALERIGREFAARGWKKVMVCLPAERAGLESLRKGAAGKTEFLEFDPTADSAETLLPERLKNFDGEAVVCESRSLHLARAFQEKHSAHFRLLRPCQFPDADGGIRSYLPDFVKHAELLSGELERLMGGDREIRHTRIGGTFSKYVPGGPYYPL